MKDMRKPLPWLRTDVPIEESRSAIMRANESGARSRISNPRLKNITISTTLTCNQGCQHCWVDAQKSETDSLATEEIVSILKQARALGAEHVKFTGGEPLTRADIGDLLESAVSYGYRVSLESNGTQLNNRRLLAKLEEVRDYLHLYVSLDGNSAETHDSFRGSPGGFSKAITALELLQERGFSFSIHTVANKSNLSELTGLYERVAALGAAQHKIILSIHALGRGTDSQGLALELAEIVEFVQQLEEFEFWDYDWRGRADSKTKLMLTLPPAFQPLHSMSSITCGWSLDFVAILASGEVALCHGLYEFGEAKAGNIRDQSLESIWNESPLFRQSRDAASDRLKGICGNCGVAPSCRGLCRATAIAHYDGDLRAPYPLCQQFYDRGWFPNYMLVDPDRDAAYRS